MCIWSRCPSPRGASWSSRPSWPPARGCTSPSSLPLHLRRRSVIWGEKPGEYFSFGFDYNLCTLKIIIMKWTIFMSAFTHPSWRSRRPCWRFPCWRQPPCRRLRGRNREPSSEGSSCGEPPARTTRRVKVANFQMTWQLQSNIVTIMQTEAMTSRLNSTSGRLHCLHCSAVLGWV